MSLDDILSRIGNILNVTSNPPSLLNGDLGCLLFLILYNKASGINDEELIYRLEIAIDKALAQNDHSHANGLSGLGWLLQYLVHKNLLDKEDVEELLNQLDDVLYETALTYFAEDNPDFLYGAMGNALYLIIRHPHNPAVEKYLEHIISELQKAGKTNSAGIQWVEREGEFYQKDSTSVLGLAHGSASKIALLSKMVARNIAGEKAKSLLKDSISYLHHLKNPSGRSLYPTTIVRGVRDGFSRLAWCHGDLGISVALLHAGRALKDEELVKDAIATCLQTVTRRDPEDTSMTDAGFCHGIAGVAHIYHRMYHYTGVTQFREAAGYWLGKLEEAADLKPNLEGLRAWNNYTRVWENHPGLLPGFAGIGLVLLSYLHESLSDWDECVLLS